MIKFLDLKRLNNKYQSSIRKNFDELIESGWYINGDNKKKFELEYSKFEEMNFCIGVGNGYDALYLILTSLIRIGKINTGDTILVPGNTFIATYNAVYNCGLNIKSVDIGEDYLISPDDIEKKIDKNVKGIVCVNLYGKLCDYKKIKKIASKHNLVVIEDSAQSHGAQYEHKCSIASAYSFYPGKNLGCLGDGGAVLTDNQELFKILESLSNYGSSRKYIHEEIGINSRLDELQAAILRSKLKDYSKVITKRRNIAKQYDKDINNDLIIKPLFNYEKLDHVFHLYVIRVSNRDNFIQYMKKNAIEVMIHYPVPCYKQIAYKYMLKHENLPVVEKFSNEIVSIPLHQEMENKEINYIISVINKYNAI